MLDPWMPAAAMASLASASRRLGSAMPPVAQNAPPPQVTRALSAALSSPRRAEIGPSLTLLQSYQRTLAASPTSPATAAATPTTPHQEAQQDTTQPAAAAAVLKKDR